MPTTPFATLQVSVNAGGAQTGGVTAALGDTIQLSAASTVGWGSNTASPVARWEITSYQVGFSCPAGWTADANGSYFVLSNSQPPSFTLHATLWGKYMLRLLVDGGVKNGKFSSDMEDTTTAISVISPNGLRDLGLNEDRQFSTDRAWVADQQQNLRQLEGSMALSATPGVAKSPVVVATAAALPANTYNNAAGTLTATSNGALTIDGVAVTSGRVLIKDEAAGARNGIYTVTQPGDGSHPYILTRAADANTSGLMLGGMAVTVQLGAVNSGGAFTLLTLPPITLGTTPLVFQNLQEQFDVRKFGARVNGTSDDGPALRLAMAAAKAVGRGTILVPHGVMLIASAGYTGVNTCGVLVDCDNIRILGAGPDKSIIKMASGCSFIPVLVQALTIGTDLAPRQVQSPQFDEFTIQYVDRGPDSAGSIQINNGQNFLVNNVHFKGDGAGMSGHHTDGLAMAFESTGRFTKVVSDGLSKGGLYSALSPNTSGDAEVKNHYGVFSVGAQISGAYSCDYHLNVHDIVSPDPITGGVGVLWFVNSGLAPIISALTDQTHFTIDYGSGNAFGDVYARYLGVFNTVKMCMEVLQVASVSTSDGGRHYAVTLAATPNQTLSVSQSLVADYQPADHISIKGFVHDVTHQGVSGASAVVGGFATNIETSLMVYDCGSYGINPQCVKGFHDKSRVQGCTAGIFAADLGPNNTAEGLCAGLVLDGDYQDNGTSGNAGIYLSAVDDVTITANARITTSDVSKYQGVGVQVQGKAVAKPNACTVAASTDLIGVTSHGYVAGQGVIFDNTANGVTGGIVYYVVAAGLVANAFRVSTQDLTASATLTASTDLVGLASHGYVAGQPVAFGSTVGGITAGTVYYVIASGLTTNAFKVSTTVGGSALDITADATSLVQSVADITSDGTNTVRRWKKCTNVKIGHFTDTGYSTSQVYHPLGRADAPDTGHYEHPLHSGSPNGGYFAPPGSLLPEDSGGQLYVKSGVGAAATGWNRVVRDDDVDALATASKILKRDSNGDAFMHNATVSAGVNNPSGGIFYSVLSGTSHLFGDSAFNSYISMNTTALTFALPLFSITEGQSFTLSIAQRTSDLAVHDTNLAAQAPFASATGTNRNSGNFTTTIPQPAAGGASGTWSVVSGGSTKIRAGGVGLALFGGTERAQPARAGQLTDTSTGTSGGSTIAAVTSFPTAANAVATLAAKINAIEDKLSAAGTGIGVTA